MLAIYGIWILYVGHQHEHWFDEAQAWLLARDSSLWQLLAERIRYEGSPGLWHLILWIVIRCGLPYELFFVIPAGFAIAGAALLLWRAPFPPWVRILIVGSYFFGYQYAIVARSYSVDLLLVPLAAMWFADRIDHPVRYAVVIGLMANLNAHGFLVAGLLGLEFLGRLVRNSSLPGAKAWAALAIAGTLGLLALATAWQPADNGFLPAERERPIYIAIDFVRNAFVDGVPPLGTGGSDMLQFILGFEGSILFLIPSAVLIRAAGHGILALAMLTALIGFSILTYASAWHGGLLFLFWIFLLWISWPTTVSISMRRWLVGTIAIICAWQGAQSIRTGLWDIGHIFSPGREAAKVIANYRATHPDGRIAAYGFKVFSAQPWLHANPFFNYHEGAPKPAYLSWKKSEPWKPFGDSREWSAIFRSHPDLIVASTSLQNGRRDQLMAHACQAGYGISQILPGAMMWRGRLVQDDTIMILTKRSGSGCVGACNVNFP
ncbi:hypothetical protein [Sphingobium sp. EM0848]|uniref:hypothetical protein n=1 Tax=Sphingobium sp. EM0848 TaxID=2743473 RepID=UPI00159CB20C|nr:hypothetical protein [Sphingobium sp. EM0848]